MDYKYIEQLLERYWECQTTLEEEAILRAFFRQEDVPASLLPYRQLFAEEDKMADEHLSEDFNERILARIGETLPAAGQPEGGFFKAHRLTLVRRLSPFYRAAAVIAIMLTIGNAAFQSMSGEADNAPQVAATLPSDSLQHPAIGGPEHQSAALAPQPADTLAK